MRPVRDLFSDLVERRLWPIAVLLVAALVAVPLVLAKSPADPAPGKAPETPAAVAAAVADEPELVVSVESDTVDAAPLRGKAKNPFRQQHVPKKAEEGGGSVATGTGGGAGVDGSGGGTGTDGGGGQKTFTTASIEVRFGKAIGPKRTIQDVPRLAPLPSAANPIVIFLGMRKDLQTAVFMISSDVHAQGDGTCVPSRKHCESIELKEGDVAFLDVAAADGSVDQYELELVAVTVGETTSQAAARAAYRRVSRAGARLLRKRVRVSANVDGRPFRIPFRYARERGVLHIAPWAVRAMRRQAGGATGSASQAVAVADARP